MAQRERQVLAYQSSSLQGRVTALERILREHGESPVNLMKTCS